MLMTEVDLNEFPREQFESGWRLDRLESQVSQCPFYAIYPVFEKYLKKEMKILESGCGLGRWVFFYHRQGYDITGMDWSEKTIEMLRSYDPAVPFVHGDARHSPFGDQQFDAILSLGTVEHAIEGPEASLRDYYRILRPGGVLIVTVPALTVFRRILYLLKRPLQLVKSLVPKRTKRDPLSLALLLRRKLKGLYLHAVAASDGYHFFEYRFPLSRFVHHLERAGFTVRESFTSFGPDGVFDDLGGIAGSWDYKLGRLDASPLTGLLLQLSPHGFDHMAVAVASKPVQNAVGGHHGSDRGERT